MPRRISFTGPYTKYTTGEGKEHSLTWYNTFNAVCAVLILRVGETLIKLVLNNCEFVFVIGSI